MVMRDRNLFKMIFRRTAILSLLVFACTLNAQSKMNDTFPFTISDNDEIYSISVFIESDKIFDKYYPFFEQNGYTGNGYCWEGHIIQILEKENVDLLKHIEFDPEAGAFFAYADSEKAQVDFVKTLSPIFSDLVRLKKFIDTADRSRIDD